MTVIEYCALALALLGAVMFAGGARRIRRRRVLSGCGRCAGSLLPLAAAAALALVSLNLHTYARLTYEQPVAELAFRSTGPQRFGAVLRLPDGQRFEHELRGDEWQLDARVLKWRGLATLAGLDARYRLERLSGRYAALADARSAERTVVAIAPRRGVDVWSLERRYPQWVPWVDARYGSATYLPMADGASFEVRLTQSGLIARPINPAAERAVGRW